MANGVAQGLLLVLFACVVSVPWQTEGALSTSLGRMQEGVLAADSVTVSHRSRSRHGESGSRPIPPPIPPAPSASAEEVERRLRQQESERHHVNKPSVLSEREIASLDTVQANAELIVVTESAVIAHPPISFQDGFLRCDFLAQIAATPPPAVAKNATAAALLMEPGSHCNLCQFLAGTMRKQLHGKKKNKHGKFTTTEVHDAVNSGMQEYCEQSTGEGYSGCCKLAQEMLSVTKTGLMRALRKDFSAPEICYRIGMCPTTEAREVAKANDSSAKEKAEMEKHKKEAQLADAQEVPNS